MQGLLIVTNIIGVSIIILIIHAIFICRQISKLGNDQELIYEFCRRRRKDFLKLFFVSLFLWVSEMTGYALLISWYDEFAVFPLISLFVSFFPIIAYFTCVISAKKKKGDSNKTEKTVAKFDDEEEDSCVVCEKSQKDEQAERLAYFKENGPVLIEKYAYTVENLIDKLTNICSNLFLNMFDQHNMLVSDAFNYVPMSDILLYPYKTGASYFLKNAVIYDGLEFNHQSIDAALNAQLQNMLALYVERLKEKIQSNSEWDDKVTLPLLIYKIIRNNVIKHYHDRYVSKCGYESLAELCQKISDPIVEEEIFTNIFGVRISNKKLIANKIEAKWFIYYYIYEHDIELPFVETYKYLCMEMKNTVANQKAEKLKKELFGD